MTGRDLRKQRGEKAETKKALFLRCFYVKGIPLNMHSTSSMAIENKNKPTTKTNDVCPDKERRNKKIRTFSLPYLVCSVRGMYEPSAFRRVKHQAPVSHRIICYDSHIRRWDESKLYVPQ